LADPAFSADQPLKDDKEEKAQDGGKTLYLRDNVPLIAAAKMGIIGQW
jgi:hypothetical protein